MIEPHLSDDAFLADVERAARNSDDLTLWWLGQSGYLVACGYDRIMIDPYLSDSLTKKYEMTGKPHVRISRRVVDPGHLRHIWAVTSSHAHTDHLDAATLRAIRETNPTVEFVVPVYEIDVARERIGVEPSIPINAGETAAFGPFSISAVPSAHDRIEQNEHGHHKYLGFVIRWRGCTIYHSGDTVVYDGLAERLLKAGPIDVAILPINGKVGNMNGRDAARLAKEIGARLVIPCHYDMFEFNTADPYAQFVPECERIGQPYRVLKLGERFSSSELPER